MRWLLLMLVLCAACGCPGRVTRTLPPPVAGDLVGHVGKLRKQADKMTAVTLSDVWIGKDRVKLTVNILVEWGGKLRFMAERPDGGTAADLASDGQTYCFVDVEHNCGECGPATAQNVGRLLQIVMPPDDIVAVMFGGTGLIAENGVVTWDAERGHEVLDLKNEETGETQRVRFDGRNKTWDVLESEVNGPDGKLRWKILHKDFHEVKKPDGGTIRLPGRSWLEQGSNSAKIEWKEHKVNREPPAGVFDIRDQVQGLPLCK